MFLCVYMYAYVCVCMYVCMYVRTCRIQVIGEGYLSVWLSSHKHDVKASKPPTVAASINWCMGIEEG